MAENKIYKSITNYINKGIIESNIEHVKEYDNFICLAKLEIDIDLDDAYTFKDMFGYLHQKSDFGAILLENDSELILLFRDYKIHQTKTILQKIKRTIWHRYNIDIKSIGITLIDPEDDYKSLMSRLEEYYVMSKIASKGKIFYGTRYFNFYEGDSNFEMLQVLFKKINMVKIHNIYQGIPVVDRSGIMDFSKGNLILKIDKNKVPFYRQEEFCYIEHDLIPNIIKANILRVNSTLNSLTLCDLEFLDESAIDRSGIRIEPERPMFASVTHDKKLICKGNIINISENAIVLRLSSPHLKKLAMSHVGKGYLTLKTQIPTQKSFITTIKTKAVIFRMDSEKVVITIFPSPVARTKIRSYISMQQSALLIELKAKLKEASEFI